jgi:anti-sigma B factor antagonist
VDSSIFVGIFEGFSWIRPRGKGSFANSPALKAYFDKRLADGEKLLVVDLAECTGMDSTFMGTLAGMASRLTATDGRLQIADPGERNRRSLEDLGLDFLMDIDPPAAIWLGTLESIRHGLHPLHQQAEPERLQSIRHVLEAHKTLSGINEKNACGFANVVGMLEDEVAEKEKLANDGEST